MNEMLDNTRYSLEERLDMAKELLMMKEKQIAKLMDQMDHLRTAHSWDLDQNSIHRMGL